MASEQDVIRDHLESVSTDRSQSRTQCPVCGPDRRKFREKTLSVKMDGDLAIYRCHHCDISGAVRMNMVEESVPTSNGSVSSEPLSRSQSEWLLGRGISEKTIETCGITGGNIYIRERSGEVPVIGCHYKNHDGSHATKWRDGAKNFSQTGSARSLWRIDKWPGGDLIITEGELDAASFIESGCFATSVPNGAPSTISKDGSSNSTKYSYLWDAKSSIESADRVILATDQDEPGGLLAEEIARRLGKARCWRLEFPDGCKDANECLMKFGPDGLRDALGSATPWPVTGLRNASEYRGDVIDLYDNGMDGGRPIGIPELDALFRACPQTLTVCTGIPGSGKSAFLAWLSLRLASQSGWQCAVFSAETATQVMLLQLASTFCQKPYEGKDRMNREELDAALDWIANRYVFLDESETHIESVLERAQAAVLRNGVRILLIDPYNFLTGSIKNYEDSVAGINALLTSLKAFAVQHEIAVWLVAHPVKMYRQQDGTVPVPTGYDVSGSAAFFNVADAGITISRLGDNRTMFTSWKARFPWVGSLGQTELSFNPRTGVFAAPSQISWGGEFDEFDAL